MHVDALITVSGGHWITGGRKGVMVMGNEQVDVPPQLSVAVTVTVVVPGGNK